MRAGVTTSVIAHAALLMIALVGLGSAKPLEPEMVESIAVDLVPISEITNIRAGSLDSKIVKTETPAVVETQKVAELAQPTGNTADDQVTPQATDKSTPAPVVNTAPKPTPAPQPEPTPDPVKDPTPPDPTPVAAPDVAPAPVEAEPQKEVAADTSADAPAAHVAPIPASKPAVLQKAPVKAPVTPPKVAAVTPKKDVTPKKPDKTDKQPDPEAKTADQVAERINSEKSRGAVTGAGGSPTLGKTDGRSATLTQSQLDGLIAKIKTCFSLPPSMIDSNDSTRLTFTLDGGGGLVADPEITNEPETPTQRALASAAKRAIMRCEPYPMAAGQDVGATFTAQQLL